MIDPEIKQLIKDTTDAELLLKDLGFQVSRSTGSEVRAPCKLHGGDNPTGFSIKTDTKTWKCFTHQCEQDASGKSNNDLFALVMKARGVNFIGAVKYLADFSGLHYDPEKLMVKPTPESRRARDTTNYIRYVSRINSRNSKPRGPSEHAVASYQLDLNNYFVEQGFLIDTLLEFEIGSKVDSEGVLRATIPIRDSQGNLVSISARRQDGDDEPRYKLDFKFNKGRILYNLHKAIATGSSTVIIVEGFKALWAVVEAGFSNVVACMGSAITEEQILALCSSGFFGCLLMLDGDEAGRKGMLSAIPRLERSFSVQPVYLPDSVSPDDLDRKELAEIIELHLLTL